LSSLAGEIDWGAAVELIKLEGFYMFGGRTESGEASNQLLIFLIARDSVHGGAKFRIIRPKTIGAPPEPRFMHTISFVPRLSVVTLYGGRNDAKKDAPILSDLWILKLSNLEWVKV
jgi:hypothetical protein|tara:strand:- start:298 stop:645 length:348 start_codon:yes stop_codon:yes gene_type:complete